ncbi:MAG: hypothetical protein HQ517_02915 [SAR324 cluster bacterium]|nr:hypothetical protein [SAR324 cluster bacterium]
MNYQAVMYSMKGLLPLPRVLMMITWIAGGLLCVSIGILAAAIFEKQVLETPFQISSYLPPVSQKSDQPMTIDEFEPIITYNVFDAEVSDAKLTEEVEIIPTAPGIDLKQIMSNLQLVGISVLQKRTAICVIKNKKENQEEIFYVNDPVFDTQATIKKIQTNANERKVYLQLNDEIGILTYEKETDPPSQQPQKVTPSRKPTISKKAGKEAHLNSPYSTDGKNFHITSGDLDSRLNNFAELLNQARMVPYFKNGKHVGYQVKAIDKGSLYEKLGLKNQDIIAEINGEPLDSMEKVMGLFKKMRNERELTVKLQRKGAPQFLNYYID